MTMNKSKSKTQTQSSTRLEAAFRKAISDTGLSLYAVAKGAEVDRAILLRFMNEERTMTLPLAGRLADFLGLELRPVAKKKHTP